MKPNPDNNNLEDKLKSNPQPKEKADKDKTLRSILDPDEFYLNCMYCGKIYTNDYQKLIYQNGKGPLGREYNPYKISTGVGPCCLDIYQQRLDELKRYKR